MIDSGIAANEIAGVLETNPKHMDKSAKKRLAKKQGGMYFYDPFSGAVTRLDKNAKGQWDFIQVDQTTYQPITADNELKISGAEVSEVKLDRPTAQIEAEKRGLYLIPERPEDQAKNKGWLSTQRRENPGAVTLIELQEIIEKENFAERFKHLKNKQRTR